MAHDGISRRWRLTLGARAGLAVIGVAVVFAAVLAVEMAGTGSKHAGDELLSAPRPILPRTLSGYSIHSQPDLATALRTAYRNRSMPIGDVEASAITLRSAEASLVAASVTDHAQSASSSFRAGVLAGAAGGFGIDADRHPFRYTIRSRVAVYTTEGPEGRLYVWFFRDAFVQLWVPSAIATEADEIQRVVLDAQVTSPSASPRAVA